MIKVWIWLAEKVARTSTLIIERRKAIPEYLRHYIKNCLKTSGPFENHSWRFRSSKIVLAHGPWNFESFENIISAHNSQIAWARLHVCFESSLIGIGQRLSSFNYQSYMSN